MSEFLTVMAYVSMILWTLFGLFMLYTSVRDDIRNEKKRKEEKQ
ncbi:hypothetical protein [Gemella sp. zg-570]|nr:hypothetical protein [Gemella sp. zg-570]